MTFEELCDIIDQCNPMHTRKITNMLRKEPYKTSLEFIFPMISQDNQYRYLAYFELLKNKKRHPPICKLNECNNYVDFSKQSFKMFCSRSCSGNYVANDPIVKEKRNQTNLERYGHENPLGNKDIRHKSKQTMVDKYGASHPMHSDKIKEKLQHTNLERYGSISPFGNVNVQDKSKQTNLERYGTEYALSNDDIQDKVKKTNLERYGHENPLGNKDIQDKVKKTNLERYGHENPLGNKDIQDKVKKTNLERYNRIHKKQHHIDMAVLQDASSLKKQIIDYGIIKTAELCNCDISTIYIYAQKYNIELPNASPYWETELAEYLDELNIRYELNTRKIIAPLELDFYLPEFNLAIELNGTYWHSDKFKDRKYHYDKWRLCHDQGIQLIQIWDTDWESTKDVWKSRLQYMTGKSTKTIYARKCSIETISSKDARLFYDQNHLQGFTTASHHLGLYHDDELVSMMSFGKTRATKDVEIELVRFCSKLGYQVTGAASKLVKYYQRQNPDMTIISFSDNMYSDGGIYETLGFSKDYDLPPDYSYIKNNQRFHKQTFTKSNIQKKFGISDSVMTSKTEHQWMDDLGYLRVYDAGKIKWVL